MPVSVNDQEEGGSFPLLFCTATLQDLTLGSRFTLHSLKQHLEVGGKII